MNLVFCIKLRIGVSDEVRSSNHSFIPLSYFSLGPIMIGLPHGFLFIHLLRNSVVPALKHKLLALVSSKTVSHWIKRPGKLNYKNNTFYPTTAFAHVQNTSHESSIHIAYFILCITEKFWFNCNQGKFLCGHRKL